MKTKEDVIESFSRLVDKVGRDFVYKENERPDDYGVECRYVENERPSCAVGVMMHEWGASIPTMLTWDSVTYSNQDDGLFSSAIEDVLSSAENLPDDFDEDARSYLIYIQSLQDSGSTYGKILDDIRTGELDEL